MRLLRISNAPTAMTGSLVGAMVGAHGAATMPTAGMIATCATGSVLLYTGGMVMNDYFDQPIDRIERPERPIVSGQVRESAALVLGMVLLVAGVGALVTVGGAVVPWALLLLATILGYNLLHRDPVAAPLLMACCRMLVPVIGAIACAPQHRPDWQLLVAVTIPLGLHTGMISLAARHEATRMPLRALGVPIDLVFAFAIVSILAPLAWMAAGALEPFPREAIAFAAPGLLISIWLVLRGRSLMLRGHAVTRGVMAWIAAIAFVDSASLAVLAGGSLVFVAAGAGILTLLLQRRVMGS
jgi:4-hydroxybenzoate polyprenyltransferase